MAVSDYPPHVPPFGSSIFFDNSSFFHRYFFLLSKTTPSVFFASACTLVKHFRAEIRAFLERTEEIMSFSGWLLPFCVVHFSL
ncbi:unnamed protein product [Cuscuta campestris]|uniref:Uncharacterized protein n=1 Tax=Cuscuta campestris TaxID=132261 RepID=A0A484LW06_9ASTE|nr:unnamed protein product [Cuscuta campestris]